MRTSLKVAIGSALAAIVVVILAVSAFGNEEPADRAAGGGSDGSTGDGMAMCVEGVPDCDDMVVVPGGDDPVSHDAGDDPLVDPVPDPQTVEPDPRAVDLRARPYDTATIGDDRRTIAIDFVSGVEPCYVLGKVTVVETDGAVTITLFEGHLETDDDVACIDIGVSKRTVVTLDEPLGGRDIVDARRVARSTATLRGCPPVLPSPRCSSTSTAPPARTTSRSTSSRRSGTMDGPDPTTRSTPERSACGRRSRAKRR